MAGQRARANATPFELSDPTEPFGVYVHVPFCASKCDYCAFATWTDRGHLTLRYLEALRTELVRAVEAGMPPATSVFVGGGTPSLVPADELARVIGTIPTVAGAEVTVECNPDDVTDALIERYLEAGVDRISLGVQSMVDHVLGSLGRRHVRTNVLRAVDVVRRGGLRSFNLDLIYGAAAETVTDWATTVEEVLDLDPPHVSAYALTVEAGTPLAVDRARHPDEDDQADKYEIIDEAFERAGLVNYEVSNWARSGHECRHNLLYWSQGDYLGVGCAAHSHRAGRRWWNLRTPERYVAAVESGHTTEASGEDLDASTRHLERLQLALRLRDGVPPEAFGPDDLAELLEAELLRRSGDRVVLTRRGRLLANAVSMRLSPEA